MDFNNELTAAAERHPDMQRFTYLQYGERKKLLATFKRLSTNNKPGLESPKIQIEPTFVREEIEANYVEAIQSFLQAAASDNWTINLNVMDIPLIAQQHSLLCR